MAAMKREFEDKINQDLENKQEEKDLLLDQFKKGEIDLKTYIDGMNAVDGMRLMNGELS
jgi:membrane-bound lytic murein transglycosylase MltF